MPSNSFATSQPQLETQGRGNGVRWSPRKHPLEISYFESDFKHAKILADFVWQRLRSLMKNRNSLPQVQAIPSGQSVEDLTVSEVLTPWRFGSAAKRLTDLVRSHTFRLDWATAQDLHHLVAGGVRDPRTFRMANIRTALLMMNGTLMNNGHRPVLVLNKDSDAFFALLKRFLESGDDGGIFAFFRSGCQPSTRPFRKTNSSRTRSHQKLCPAPSNTHSRDL